MTRVSAGGLRSARTNDTASEPENARVDCVGTDSAYGLGGAKQQCAWPDSRRTGETVLRSGPCLVREVETICEQTSSATRAKLLRAEGILLGRGDSLSTPQHLERPAELGVLGRPRFSRYLGIRRKD